MNRQYVKWHSPSLGRSMELLVFGHAGTPLLVFPTAKGRFFDYEDRGMIEAIRPRFENGELQAFCVDSIDAESWYNESAPPGARVLRHLDYEDYLLREAIPYILSQNRTSAPLVTGCNFGAYHAVNFCLRHPDLVSGCVSMGGAFDIHQFLNGYFDDNCYFNCPPDFLQNLTDTWYHGRFRELSKFVLATGEHDFCLEENIRLSHIMNERGIPHSLDVWGTGTGHDWPWWHQMAAKFLP
ncbi:MAG: esterase [Terriglobia bacterium]